MATYFKDTYFADQGASEDNDDDDDDAVFSQGRQDDGNYTYGVSLSPDSTDVAPWKSLAMDGTAHSSQHPVFEPSSELECINEQDEEMLDNATAEVTNWKFASPDSNQSYNLLTLSERERHELYEELWSTQTIALSELCTPTFCTDFPELADEVLQAYLQNVTVTATIWTNYDSYAGTFFLQPSRVQDCGKVYLSPHQRARLEQLDWGMLEMKNLQLQIGTPFRTLYCLFLTVTPSESKQRSRVTMQARRVLESNGPHETLDGCVRDSINDLMAAEGWHGKHGLTLKDIDTMAESFVFKPGDDVAYYRYFVD